MWFLVWTMFGLCLGKTFDAIELGQELKEHFVSSWDVPILVCLAHNMSNLETHSSVVGPYGNYHGVFGLSEREIELCNMTLNDMLDDDIADDIVCLEESLSRRTFLTRRTALIINYRKLFWPELCYEWMEHLSFDDEYQRQNQSSGHHCKKHTIANGTVNGSLVLLVLLLNIIQLMCFIAIWVALKPKMIVRNVINGIPLK
uniref:Alpha-lactalbumin n=1 Tax=Lygus hesperus TaxID=30085 RepID=A0A146M0G6_LYGHE